MPPPIITTCGVSPAISDVLKGEVCMTILESYQTYLKLSKLCYYSRFQRGCQDIPHMKKGEFKRGQSPRLITHHNSCGGVRLAIVSRVAVWYDSSNVVGRGGRIRLLRIL